MKVLIVEDDLASLSFLEMILKKEGFDYRTAENGADGFEVFKEYLPDIVLTDVNMDLMTGLELLEKVKKEKPDTIVILLTAYTSEENVMVAMKYGANNYFKKPVLKNTFLSVLRKYANIVQTQNYDKEISSFQTRHNFNMQFPSSIDIIPSIVNFLLKETNGILSQEKQLDVRLGLSELLLNAVEHGNLEITFDEKDHAIQNDTLQDLYLERLSNPALSQRKVDVSYTMNMDSCEWVITDQGSGFDAKALPDPVAEDGLLRMHGRGIFICKFQFDTMEYIGCGNQVKVSKKI